MKVVFLGTPSFAVPSLEALIKSRHEVLAVVCQPDKKVGREKQIVFSPIKRLALDNGIKVLQYGKIRLEGVTDLKNLKPDIMISCAYGQILSQEIIDIAPHGIINVHGSLLPKYRGAAPIQQAIIDGEKETGVTIMQTDAGVDTGDILIAKRTPIYDDESAGELFDRLSVIGADLLITALDMIESGNINPIKQDETKATHVSMIKKEDAKINWNDSAKKIFYFIRGMNPWPVAYTFYGEKMIKIFSGEVVNRPDDNGVAGEVLVCNPSEGLIVSCGEGCLKIKELQIEGARRLPAHDFVLGRKIAVGDKFQW